MIGQHIGYRYDVNLLPDYKKVTPFLKKYIEHMGWDDLNWLEDVHMGYEEGRPAVFDRNANGWVTIPKKIKLPDSQQEKDMIARLKKVFLMVAGSAVQKYGPQLEDHQQLLMSASNILIKVYMAESAILRTEKNIKRFGEDSQKEQLAMSKLNLYHAVDDIVKNAKEAIVSFAEGDEQRMMLMGLKRFTKYQNQPNVVDLRKTIATTLTEANTYCY